MERAFPAEISLIRDRVPSQQLHCRALYRHDNVLHLLGGRRRLEDRPLRRLGFIVVRFGSSVRDVTDADSIQDDENKCVLVLIVLSTQVELMVG